MDERPPNRADHPGRQVGREAIGTYNQELEAWRQAEAAQRPRVGNYAEYMRSIGMAHQVPKG